MSLRTDFIRVATSGKTVDGREILPEQIDQMAESYNPALYSANINLEHIRGVLPDGPFRNYGRVVAAEARTVEEGKRALFVQLEPTADLIEMNRNGQKRHASVEINPDFEGTGKAYLMGLAVTDSPASVGTQIMRFALLKDENFSGPAADKIMDPVEIGELKFSDGDATTLFTRVKGFLSGKQVSDDKRFNAFEEALTEVARAVGDMRTDIAAFAASEQASATTPAVAQTEPAQPDPATAKIAELSAQIAELQKLSALADPTQPQRPTHSGGGDFARTDC